MYRHVQVTIIPRQPGKELSVPEKLDVVGWFMYDVIWDFQVSRSFLFSLTDFCDLSLLGEGDLSRDLWDLDLGEGGDLWELRLGEGDLSRDLWDLDLGEGDLCELLRLGEQGNLLRAINNKTVTR